METYHIRSHNDTGSRHTLQGFTLTETVSKPAEDKIHHRDIYREGGTPSNHLFPVDRERQGWPPIVSDVRPEAARIISTIPHHPPHIAYQYV